MSVGLPLLSRLNYLSIYQMDVAMKFCSGVDGAQRMNINGFGDILTSLLVPSSGQNFNLTCTLVYDQILAKVMTFPSVTAVFIFVAN